MDPKFVSFLGAVVAIGTAFATPIALLMWVRARTRAPAALTPLDAAERAELEELRGRADLLAEAQERLLAMEERLDFTERLLVQQRDDALRALPRSDAP